MMLRARALSDYLALWLLQGREFCAVPNNLTASSPQNSNRPQHQAHPNILSSIFPYPLSPSPTSLHTSPPIPSISPLIASFTIFPQSFAYGFVRTAISLATSLPYRPPISKSRLAISSSCSLLLFRSWGGRRDCSRCFDERPCWAVESRGASRDFASRQVRWPRCV